MNNEHIVGRIEQLTDKPSPPQRDWKEINAQPPITTMNNESKCCDKCWNLMGMAENPPQFSCSNSSCECHTLAPEDWEEVASIATRAWSLHKNGFSTFADFICKAVCALLSSEKAAARREGAERIQSDLIDIGLANTSLRGAVTTNQINDYFAARSEGVNG